MEILMQLSVHTSDLTGLRFGSLTAVKPSHKGLNNTMYWVYQCDCGKEHTARGNTVKYIANKTLKQGITNIPSCGCVELANKTKHGFRTSKDTHPAYKSYRGIIDRCFNSNAPSYKWYGAVGVTVCKEWLDNPKAFVEWSISNGWAEGLHIDKDILCSTKGISPHIYSPETCQWVTPKVNVGFATNRDNFGKHPNVKLSNEDVKEIERLYFSGEQTNQSELSRMYGLKQPGSIGRLIRLAKARLV